MLEVVVIKHINKYKIPAIIIFISISIITIIIFNVLYRIEYETLSKELYQGYIVISKDNHIITNQFF